MVQLYHITNQGGQMDNPTTGVDDNELNQMIAGLGNQNTPGGQAAQMPQIVNRPTVQPPSSTTMATPASVAPTTTPITPDPIPTTTISEDPTPPAGAPPISSSDSSLSDIKQDALKELRPLVEKLELPADEKFDTLLLIIRSTDDVSLLPEAHNAARAIADETRRAQALLDVIKEIDYFGQQSKS